MADADAAEAVAEHPDSALENHSHPHPHEHNTERTEPQFNPAATEFVPSIANSDSRQEEEDKV